MNRKPVSWAKALKQIFNPLRKKQKQKQKLDAKLSVESLGDRIVPATLIVNTAADSLTFNSGTLTGSLRGAIQFANAGTDSSYTIVLQQNVTLSLLNSAGQENANQTGDLDIVNGVSTAKTYIITSTTGNTFSISAAAGFNDRLFQITGTNVTVQFKSVELTDGQARDDGTAGAAVDAGTAEGGAVLNQGAAVGFTSSVVTENTAAGAAGAVGLAGNKTTPNGGNGGNGMSAFGGGIYSTAGTITVTKSTFDENKAIGGDGGNGGAGWTQTVAGQGVGNGGNGGNGGNKAGGAFYLVAGNLSITAGSTVDDNFAYSGGLGGTGGVGGARVFGAGAAGNGGNGGTSGTGFGGAVYSTAGNVTIDGSTVDDNEVWAQGGGHGGDGGAAKIVGAVGGNGGTGGNGSDGAGGAVYVVTGAVTVSGGSSVEDNFAYGGYGYYGGDGGANTKAVGNGGNGGNAGNAGNGSGGGIYDQTGNVEIEGASSVDDNDAHGYRGYSGGDGGAAGTSQGAGGNGGNGGNAGSSFGGGVFIGTGNLTVDTGSFLNGNDAVVTQDAGTGGTGAAGGPNGGKGGNGGNGGNAGSGSGGGAYVQSGDVTVDNASFVNSNNASADFAGDGGNGGKGFAGGGIGGKGGIGGNGTGGGIYVGTGAVTIDHASDVNSNTASGSEGGSGGSGGLGTGGGANGGAGGSGGNGGNGAGGGVWINSGNVTLDNESEVNFNNANGEDGGDGSVGGNGVGADGGAGGNGGNGGTGQGGGIWAGGGNVTVDHSASVKSNTAEGEDGARGGDAGNGSILGGAGGAGGTGGNASGGGIYATGGTVTVQGTATVIDNKAEAADGGSGEDGGKASKTNGVGGVGGAGAAGGAAAGGGVWIGTGAIVVTGSASVGANGAFGADGGSGGSGGSGGGGGNDHGGAGGVGGAGGAGAGGGIYAVSATVTVNVNGIVKDNKATGADGGSGGTGGGGGAGGAGANGGVGGMGAGGGIYAGAGAVLLEGAAQVFDNVASGSDGGAGGAGGGAAAGGKGGNGGGALGGGVYIGTGSFAMADGNVSNNTAKFAGNGGKGGAGAGGAGGNGGGTLGGGVYVASGATSVSIKDSSLWGNTAKSGGDGGAAGGGVQGNGGNVFGGGLYNAATNALISNSSVLDNEAIDAGTGAANGKAQGGGVFNAGTLALHSATVAFNDSDDVGGGVRNTGTLTLVSTILSNNTSGTAQKDLANTGTATASFSLIATTAGHTIINGTSGNLIGADPDLAAAQFDAVTGTWYENLRFGSVAIDTGSNPDNVQSDQLGHTTASDTTFVDPPTVNFPNDSHVRVQNAKADMGAIESPGTVPPPPQSYTAIADNQGNVQIINSSTGQVLRTFRPFDTAASKYVGLMSVALGDVNDDGVPDLLVATRGARAGKVKVFDGATLINKADTVLPTDAFIVKFPVNGYKQGLTVASADLDNDGFSDIVVATRKTTINGVATPGQVLAFSGKSGAVLGSTAPFGASYNGGIYVAAEAGGHVLVSAANTSDVKIFNVSGGALTQVGSDINPLGAGAVINAKNGSGQITAFTTAAGATPEFAVGNLNDTTGAVTVNVYTAAGAPATPASFVAAASGATFFGMGAVDINQDGNDQLLLAILPDANNIINVTNPDGTAGTTLPALLTLSGQVAVAGA